MACMHVCVCINEQRIDSIINYKKQYHSNIGEGIHKDMMMATRLKGKSQPSHSPVVCGVVGVSFIT